MQDKDSFLIEQAYMDMLNKRVVKEEFDGDHDTNHDFEEYMQECIRAAFEEINSDAKLHAELKQYAKKIGAEVAPDATVEELYYALPADCEPCQKVTEYLQQAEEESSQCWRDEQSYQDTLASHRRE